MIVVPKFHEFTLSFDTLHVVKKSKWKYLSKIEKNPQNVSIIENQYQLLHKYVIKQIYVKGLLYISEDIENTKNNHINFFLRINFFLLIWEGLSQFGLFKKNYYGVVFWEGGI